jgi:hypothetical protein
MPASSGEARFVEAQTLGQKLLSDLTALTKSAVFPEPDAYLLLLSSASTTAEERRLL